MYNIAIVIPTYERIKKLDRCLSSIFKSTYQNFKIYVYADNKDEATLSHVGHITKKYTKVTCFMNSQHLGVIGSWNRFTRELWDSSWDIMAWIVDDVELYDDCLDRAVTAMQASFSDTDGVIGLAQECPGHPEYTYKPYGQVLLGRRFIQRYAAVEYAVCAPMYSWAYQDEEMYRFACSLNKFSHCEGARLKHYHPAFIPTEMDNTHHISRENLRQDKEIYHRRKDGGLTWGNSWVR